MALTTSSQESFHSPGTDPSGRPRNISPEAAILFDKSLVAKSLNIPEVASIHVKNTENYYRWVNRLHGNGSRYMQHRAMGFVNATLDDVDVLVADNIVCEKNEITSHDVILMKIEYGRWASHVKRNMQVSEILQRMRGVHTRDEELNQDVFAEGGRPATMSVNQDLGKLAKSFIPENPEAIINGQSQEAVDKVKEQTAELRKKHARQHAKE